MADAEGEKAQRFYRPELDGLRFFAFIFVFFHHFWPIRPLARGHFLEPVAAWLQDYGWAGVDLFFVLSGYLITTLLLREREERGAIHIGHFYLRRLLRIWPLYYVALLLFMLVFPALQIEVLGPVWGDRVYGWLVNRWAPAFVVFTGNFAISQDGWSGWSAIDPLWSLSMEEQFYLLWPALLVLVPRKRVVWALIVLLILPVWMRYAFTVLQVTHPMIFTHPLCRMDSFAWGALLALALAHPRGAAWHRRFGGLLWAGVPLVVLPQMLDVRIAAPGLTQVWVYTSLAVGFTCLITTLLRPGSWAAKALALPPLVWLGRISFGLYVWHCIGISLALRWWKENMPFEWGPWLLVFFIALGISVAVATVSYFVLERPLLRLKKRFTYVRSRPV